MRLEKVAVDLLATVLALDADRCFVDFVVLFQCSVFVFKHRAPIFDFFESWCQIFISFNHLWTILDVFVSFVLS